MKNIFTLLVFLFMAFQGSEILAQVTPADTNLYRVVKSNNQEYIGRILNDDGREVLLETSALGKIYIVKSDIQSITIVHREIDFVGDEYRGTGVFTTRYQFSTNAFPLQKHDNYALVNLYGPEVHFSVSKNLSVGVMATWIASPIVLALKYTIPTRNEKLNFGFGTLLGSAGYLNQGKGYGGLHWGMVTYGDRKNNVTLSLGYSYLNMGEYSESSSYQPGTYPAVFTNGYWQFEFPQNTVQTTKTPATKAPILGIAGITSVGKKASFVMDMMFMFGKKVESDMYQSVDYNYDPLNNPSSLVVGPVLTLQRITNSINCLIMPGMRFQKSENSAFQVSLAGVIGRRERIYNGELDVRRYSFPVPMCTWFYKF
jgi:hypothetical protein